VNKAQVRLCGGGAAEWEMGGEKTPPKLWSAVESMKYRTKRGEQFEEGRGFSREEKEKAGRIRLKHEWGEKKRGLTWKALN